MEVKINKDIREFSESIFFGLTMRQFIFSILACGITILLYFLLRNYLGIETLSWICILGASPFAALGFVKYNGMTAEKFIIAFIKSQFLMPKKIDIKGNVSHKKVTEQSNANTEYKEFGHPSIANKNNKQVNNSTTNKKPINKFLRLIYKKEYIEQLERERGIYYAKNFQ